MTYTTPEWKPVTTELNDQVRRLAYESTGEGLHHEDWCEDPTCLHKERP